jgi:hypothetical protein
VLFRSDQTISLFGKEVRWPGLDPSTGKFTNGSFSDPLVEPSFIPAETINLILDNLGNLVAGMGQTPNNHDPNQLFKAVKEFHFPVGAMLSVYPDEPSPVERGWPGDWEIWSHRAVEYGVSAAPPPSFVDYYVLAGNSIPAGATPVVCYHKAGDDFRLYQFISQTAAYTVPAELDPVKWTYLQPGVIDGRRKCGNALTEEDYGIGDQILSGPYQDFYVCEVIVPGGKFAGVEGGNRPTFVFGGVQQDTIRELYGRIARPQGPSHAFIFGRESTVDGVLGVYNITSNADSSFSGSGKNWSSADIDFMASRAVKTGPEFQPVHFSTRIWRRTRLKKTVQGGPQ